MANPSPLDLGKRERQIVEALYRLEEASVAQVCQALPEPPSYSTVRAMLNSLVAKRVVRFRHQGKRYLYRPVAPREKTGRTALRNLVKNFFAGEPLDAVAALLDEHADRLAPNELERIKRIIDEAEKNA